MIRILKDRYPYLDSYLFTTAVAQLSIPIEQAQQALWVVSDEAKRGKLESQMNITRILSSDHLKSVNTKKERLIILWFVEISPELQADFFIRINSLLQRNAQLLIVAFNRIKNRFHTKSDDKNHLKHLQSCLKHHGFNLKAAGLFGYQPRFLAHLGFTKNLIWLEKAGNRWWPMRAACYNLSFER